MLDDDTTYELSHDRIHNEWMTAAASASEFIKARGEAGLREAQAAIGQLINKLKRKDKAGQTNTRVVTTQAKSCHTPVYNLVNL